jgi:imidazolonepropionase-like amidohydrolase
MLTRYGFTTVVDTASDLENTVALRERIEKGEVRGPRILTAGVPIYPPNGIPIYLADLPRELRERLPQPTTPEQAVAHVRANAAGGAEATKLFVVTPQARGQTRQMPATIAKAATAEAHRRGQLVVVHPTNLDGMRLALDAGADALVHTTLDSSEPWPQEDLQRAIDAHIAIAPTLMLLPYELEKQRVPADVAATLVASAVQQFGVFAAGGGYVIFGTDVGYMSRFDPTEEYALMAEAGLTAMQILASLTSAQARLWKEDERRGRIAAGYDADLVVLAADPAQDVRSFAQVQCVVRAGEVIYSRAAAPAVN